jgi:uncharacterized protein
MPLRVVDQTTGVIIVDRAEVANTKESRRRGLLGRSSVGEREGVWIVPCSSIHTIGMQFAIDVLFIDRDGRIVHIEEIPPNVQRFSIGTAYSVLELARGRAGSCGARSGDILLFQRV